MNRDGPLRRHAQERRFHFEEMAPDRVANADQPIDTRVQVAHPRHGVEETDGADDAAITHDLHGQSLARTQAVADGLVIERVHDVIAAALQFFAQRRDSRLVEVRGQAYIDGLDARVGQRLVVRVIGGADHGNVDTGLVQADKRRNRGPVSGLGDAQRSYRHAQPSKSGFSSMRTATCWPVTENAMYSYFTPDFSTNSWKALNSCCCQR